jgi:hypothetical protein
MKKLLLFVIFSSLTFSAIAQKNRIVLDSTKGSDIFLTIKIDQFDLKEVQTENGVKKVVTAEKLSAMMKEGAPDIPKIVASLIIPNKALMQFEITNSSFTDYYNIEIAPSKGNFSRQINPTTIPYKYGKEYQKNSFYPYELAKFDSEYIMRDFRGQNIQIFPIQYNPITKVLRIYNELKLKIFTLGEGGENQILKSNTDNTKRNTIDADFHEIYNKSFLNYKSILNVNNLPIGEAGKMLIICHDAWVGAMQSFVNWKNTIGRNTTIISVSEAGGTAANIKNYVTNYYNTNGLAFLLLVGDSNQVPTNSGANLGGDSDNAYAYILGNDKYQEFMVGRFSAETVVDVNTQVARVLNYENGSQLASDWLNKILSIASQEGPGDDNELDYEHLRNIQSDLLGFTYSNPVFELFEGSQGNFDAPGFPIVNQVTTALNSGVGIINYTGHGSDTSWGTTGFSNQDLNSLYNKNKLPFIFDVACVNGNFVGGTCFAEAWVRAQKDGEPTGAIAVVASTINQSWSPPMVGQDEMNDILTGLSSIGTRRTFGSIIVNGFFKMNAETLDYDMTDAWTCFGDPSLLIRTNNPIAMTVNHVNSILASANSFMVGCDFNGALATLSYNGQIIGTALVVNGFAQIPVSNLIPGQNITLAVVGFNKVTYLSQLVVVPPTGSFLVVDSIVSTINYGETKNIDLSLKNLGTVNATNAQAIISSSNNNLTINNPIINFGNIASNNNTANSNNTHTISVANNCVDQTILNIDISMSDSSPQTSSEVKSIIVNAPNLNVLNFSINDNLTNNNGVLDPGETANIVIQAENIGHADVSNVIGSIFTNSGFLSINNITTLPTTLANNEIKNFTFNVTCNASTPVGTLTNFDFSVTGGSTNQYSSSRSFNLVIGFVPSYCVANASITTDEFIERVQFNTIDNISQQGAGYNNYTNISTNVNRGQIIPITIINGEHWDGNLIGCWVDWNYDGDFNDTNESITINYAVGANNTGIGTGNIAIPNNAILGPVRLRVRVQYQGNLFSCGTTEYGEVEDYTLNIQENLGLVDFENSFAIYPNPTKDNFTIQLNPYLLNEDTVLDIYNVLGQNVYNQKIMTENILIPFNQSEGIYIVKINSKNQILTKKLVVKK